MEHSPYSPAHPTVMTTSRESPNPLRPYYIPPTTDLPPGGAATGNTTSGPGLSAASRTSRPAPSSSLGTQARDILSDLDYGDYIRDSTESTTGMGKRLLDQALWKYTSVLLAQPFEVAKITLQCHYAQETLPISHRPSLDSRRSSSRYQPSYHPSSSPESSDDESSYFTSAAPTRHSQVLTPSSSEKRPQYPSRSHSATPTPSSYPVQTHKLSLQRPDAVLEVLAQLWNRESAWGVWKGTNATFIYTVLAKTVESWMRSMLSALFGLPDPGLGLLAGTTERMGGLDVFDSPAPWLSLGVVVAASGIAGVLLAPLDIVRTRLILTTTTSNPRGIRSSLRSLASITCPSSLFPITLLHSTIPSFITSATPLILRTSLSIDPLLTPTLYTISTFLTATAELFVKLPLETVMRRGHIATCFPQQHAHAMHAKSADEMKVVDESLNVDVGPYTGVLGSMAFIVNQEGSRQAEGKTKKAQTMSRVPATRKGQGVRGLWRGWRVGMWALVGVWGAAALGGGGGEGEF